MNGYTRRGKQVLVWGIAAVAIAGATSSTIVADVAPQGGDNFPRAFYVRRQQDPRAFTFKRANVQEAARIRTARAALMTRVRDLSSDEASRAVSDRATEIAVRGVRTIPVLPVLYKNTASKPFEESALETRLFAAQGQTMRTFYKENSYNLLDVTGSVRQFHRLPNVDTFYEGADFTEPNGQVSPCNGMCSQAKLADLLRGALAAADAAVDFRQLDNDGPDGQPNSGDDDGFADFVAFVHQGAPPNRNIWSHRWAITSQGAQEFETGDDAAGGGKIKVDDYVIMPALNCDGTTMIHIGVFVHEFGHAFGLPDLYDTVATNGRTQGAGNWCLMASGSWGGDNQSPELPSHMSAWAKVFLGWLQPQLVTGTQTVNLAPVYSARTAALKVQISNTQYYLVEHRNHTGFDAKLKGTGLLVWRINDTVVNAGLQTNRVNADAVMGVDLIEADGQNHLHLASNAGGNRADAGDPYTGSANNTRLDNTSNPKVQQGNPLALCSIGSGTGTMNVQVKIGSNSCQ
jgi:M6 family metalloprotease-like protein